MSVYVDPLVEYPASATTDKGLPGRWWCHLTGDSSEELMAFAEWIGLKGRWVQHAGVPGREHFDLTPGKRALAVAFGAVEIDFREAAARMQKDLAQARKTERPVFGSRA